MKINPTFYGNSSITSLILMSLLFAFTTCKKDQSNEIQQNEIFNKEAAKEWYYSTFKKSKEWQQSNVNGKQLPAWKYGTYRKVGSMEIVEFPLKKQTTSFAILSEGLTSEQRRTIFNGSLSKVIFIKTPDGEISVREVDYMPDYIYLKQKGYDISALSLGTDNNDFTGRLIVKNWGGEKLLVIKMDRGNVVAKGKIQGKKNINSESLTSGCTVIFTCDEMETCTFFQEGDQWINTGNCSDPWFGNCYSEIYGCDEGGDPPGDQCNFGSSESCECQLFGLGCDGGGGGPVNNDDNDGISEVKEITKIIEDPCLNETLNSSISTNLNNTITSILYNTFGGTKDFNIHFKDAPLNNYMKDGNTNTSIWPNGRIDIIITLNTEVLPDASKEYTAATIYHEIVHAYLTTSGVQPGIGIQHIAMANDYVSKLTDALLSAYPNLDSLDAKALAWGGLQDTPAFDSIRVNHLSEYNDLLSRNAQHRVSTKGTPCP